MCLLILEITVFSVEDEDFLEVALQAADSLAVFEVLNFLSALVAVFTTGIWVLSIVVWDIGVHAFILWDHDVLIVDDVQLCKGADVASVVLTSRASVEETISLKISLVAFITNWC